MRTDSDGLQTERLADIIIITEKVELEQSVAVLQSAKYCRIIVTIKASSTP